MRLLVCYAAEIEGAQVAAAFPEISYRLGVGKVEATLSLTRILAGYADNRLPDAVVLFGICGAYPESHGGRSDLAVGDLCVVASDRLADEGVQTPERFISLHELGFAPSGPFEADRVLTASFVRHLGAKLVAGATVSACSGTDQASRVLARRYAVAVETMEGAAAARVCNDFGVPFTQLRCVSNPTGERDLGRWDVTGACERVQNAMLRAMRGEWSDA